MSNPGLILLAQANAKSLRVQHLVVEDNIGESIHIHLNNMRIDLTIAEFLALSKQMRLATDELAKFGLPALNTVAPEFLSSLGQEFFDIQAIEHSSKNIRSLKFDPATRSKSPAPTYLDIHNPHQLRTQLKGQVVIDHDSKVLYGAPILAWLHRQAYEGDIPVTSIKFKHPTQANAKANAKADSTANPRPPTHHVLILAGMSACGKTTLLRNAISQQTQLFDEAADQLLHSFSLPSVFPENNLTLEQRFELNTWVHEVDLIQMHAQNIGPRNLLVHFDLFWFLAMSRAWNPDMPLTAETEKFLALVQDRHALLQAFKVLTQLKCMARANVHIKVLKPPYRDICTWFLERERTKTIPIQSAHDRFLIEHVYNNSSSGEAIYDNIYAAWRQVFVKA